MPMIERRTQDTPVAVERRKRGRPPLADALSVRVVVRLSPSQRASLEAIAELNQQDLATFIREAIDEAVGDCSDERVFR